MRNIASTSLFKFAVIAVLGLMLTASLGACGKRGEPYRPHEISSLSYQ